MRVTVVFDRDFGAQEQPDLGDAFWLIESPRNRALATRLWAAGATDPNSAVFRAPDAALLDDDALARFEDVDLHHPNWTAITFVGIPLTKELQNQFASYELSATPGDNSFVVGR
jgi:hypothetical protein